MNLAVGQLRWHFDSEPTAGRKWADELGRAFRFAFGSGASLPVGFLFFIGNRPGFCAASPCGSVLFPWGIEALASPSAFLAHFVFCGGGIALRAFC